MNIESVTYESINERRLKSLRARVKIMDQNNNLISENIWYGENLDNIEFWVRLSLNELMLKTNSKGISYTIEEVI